MSILLGRSHSAPEAIGAPRKRVAKACVQCRLKKTKCDASYPCRRCREDDRTCSYALQTKLRKKERPKGYTELLENDYIRIVAGLKESYRRLQEAGAWRDAPLPEHNGKVAVHDILEALGVRNISCSEGDEPAGILLPCPRCRAQLLPNDEEEDEMETTPTEEGESSAGHSFAPWDFPGDAGLSLSAPAMVPAMESSKINASEHQTSNEHQQAPADLGYFQAMDSAEPSNWLQLASDYANSSWTPGHSTLQLVQEQSSWAGYETMPQ